ncbi:beta-phosphoglucomutase family hydrolase [Dactylosporangium matsuzakiense]|uniref:beta-phosphoglucomutase family hydrolase n=1 Tax=Dactylosporangium matsuzakiense TaxID=53360 RepID=UPI0021C41352|nr:beta-phosphoglucomutase family hydrolase [Dactylosporangium matsuzakiense]UWZ43975.1 beta-phosphoglucomutase family hydrolase [Dactylosporangium matsuzakiense]
MLGLPDHVTACLFDLDGVLTPTAVIHNKAWTAMFDEFLKAKGQPEFDPVHDYNDYVDGKPREVGVRDFLASRGISLPEGTPDDPPEAETIWGLGNRKNARVLELLAEGGLEPYPTSVTYLQRAREAGLRTAVVSSSANTLQVVTSTGIDRYLETRVDGVTIRERGLKGKPAPDTFLEAARELGVEPANAAVFEDALAGVAAGRAGGFYVVGVDRVGGKHAADLARDGADTVVADLGELL